MYIQDVIKAKRGEIYYVEQAASYGAEQRSGRPGIVVSNDKNNEFSYAVEVVYLTTKPKKELPTHVSINSSGRPSTALCEQVHTVAAERLTSYIGSCTSSEMAMIDVALAISLGIDAIAPKVVEVPVEVIKEVPVPVDDSKELIAAKAQLEILQDMYREALTKLARKERSDKGKKRTV